MGLIMLRTVTFFLIFTTRPVTKTFQANDNIFSESPSSINDKFKPGDVVPMKKNQSVIPAEIIEKTILFIRGEKVMFDADLAQLYGVTTGNLIQAVTRNRGRFPKDFMFQLSYQEVRHLKSQIVTSNSEHPKIIEEKTISSRSKKAELLQEVPSLISQSVISNLQASDFTHVFSAAVYSLLKRGGRRKLPYVFTEQGIAMLSSVLNSERAINVNIEIMRAFVRLRQMISSHTELRRKLDALESKYDEQFRIVFDAIRKLLTPSTPKKKQKIGFHES